MSQLRIVTTLNITLIPAMRGCNTARAVGEHIEQRRDHVLHENLSGASWLAVSGEVAPQLTCRRLGLRRLEVVSELSLCGCTETNARRADEGADDSGGNGSQLTCRGLGGVDAGKEPGVKAAKMLSRKVKLVLVVDGEVTRK